MSRALFAILTLLLAGRLVHAQPTTTRVSVGPGASQANGLSGSPAISADGRWIAFSSEASNLAAGDTNGASDVFVYDRQAGTTTRVSVGPGGIQANGSSWRPAISGDGRWVVFESFATNLVMADTNGWSDVFLHDLQTGTTSRVSVGPGGLQSNGSAGTPLISADGSLVAFSSSASNLVLNDTNGQYDAFLHDRRSGHTVLVSVGEGGVQGNRQTFLRAMSPDGRWIAFDSLADNLVAGDTNGQFDAFVRDRYTSTTSRVSIGTDGVQGNSWSGAGAISADGRWVVFDANASNLVPGDTNGAYDVFLHDRHTGSTSRVSVGTGGTQANNNSSGARITADGRWVLFHSFATNLVAGDTNNAGDIFAHDRHTGFTFRKNFAPGGAQGNGHSLAGAMSPDGRLVTFQSFANNLVAGDTNNVGDIFVHELAESACTVILAPPSIPVAMSGATGSVVVLSDAGCSWSAVSGDPSWLTVTAGSNGAGVGVVSFAAAGSGGTPRNGTIIIGGVALTVEQTLAESPAPPIGLAAYSVVGTLVTVRWSLPPGNPAPTGFVLEGGVNPGEVLASLPTGSADPTFTFTAPTGSFYVRVHALNGAVRSAASNEIRIHVNVAVAPSAPANLLGLVDGSTVALAWTNTYAGSAPASLVLDVSGALVTSLPLGLTDGFSFAGVPDGTYTLALRAQNAAGTSPPSNAVTLTFPGPCTGPPLTPANLLAYRVGSTVFVDWAPAATGPAPTGYRLDVTGAFVGSFPTSARAMSGVVGPGSYTLSVVATNACGAGAATAPHTVVVP